MFYPYSQELQSASQSFSKGNFALWFNKLVPLNNEKDCKACGYKGNDKEAVLYYKDKYDSMIKNVGLKKMLAKKHDDQAQLCEHFMENGYDCIVFWAKLKSPLITGIGQTHPNEVGMVFDHAMGIPYIPASSIKGVVRLAHIIGLISGKDHREYIEGDQLIESNVKTMIPQIFGGDLELGETSNKTLEKRRGAAIFLDAYAAVVPDLQVDVINPHYGKYYGDEKDITPPADYLDPVPVKFLTVRPGVTFIFRVLIPKDSDLKIHVVEAYKKALTVDGIGAKTAVGYGVFDIVKIAKDENASGDKPTSMPATETAKTPLEKMIKALALIKPEETGKISGEIIGQMDKDLTSDADRAFVAKKIKEKLSSKAFKKLDKKRNGYLSGLIEIEKI